SHAGQSELRCTTVRSCDRRWSGPAGRFRPDNALSMCQVPNTDNFAPLNVGQLKNVASVYYDRLAEVGYNWQTGTYGTPTAPYPWTGTANPENAAPATVGQIKKLFAFDLTTAFLALDSDSDGMPNWWEQYNALDPYVADAGADPDGDGVSNATRYSQGALVWTPAPDADGDGASDAEEDYEG